MGGIRVVKAFANEAYESGSSPWTTCRYRETKLTAYKIMAVSLSLSYMLMRFVSCLSWCAAPGSCIQGSLTYGEFVAFLLLTNVFFRPIEKINAVIESYPKGIAGFKRYLEIMRDRARYPGRAGCHRRSSNSPATSATRMSPLATTSTARSSATST